MDAQGFYRAMRCEVWSCFSGKCLVWSLIKVGKCPTQANGWLTGPPVLFGTLRQLAASILVK